MAAKLAWDGRILDLHLWTEAGVNRVGIVRARSEGFEYDYVTNVGGRVVSDPYQQEGDARRDCERDVRRLLKEAWVPVDG